MSVYRPYAIPCPRRGGKGEKDVTPFVQGTAPTIVAFVLWQFEAGGVQNLPACGDDERSRRPDRHRD